ncbi:conserved hypothetical protein [Frankia canadensis]|uniref:Uncharacterized protein n=1 Tax=Frankia canadensis TaxID=1836972 RepID=A0A2I2KNB6_9ACTN|nr:conserved hypothetical protein [Frankia canadensis]SOU54436.1 conserved hypothetical protein [Frankia canadensis]
MSDAPTDPGPEHAESDPADRAAAPTDPSSTGPAGPSDPPTDDGRPPLRPVDWDGSFSRTWNSRYANEVMNRLAAEHELEWDEREHDERMREFRDKANAEADARDARAREERQRAWERALDEATSADDARSRLFDKLDRLDRSSGVAEASPEADDHGSSDGR